MPSRDSFVGQDDFHVPDMIGEVLGYRAWIYAADGFLRACNYDYYWQPGENVMSCKPGRRSWSEQTRAEHLLGQPTAYCTCGFYALKDPHPYAFESEWFGGIVGMWGKIVEGTQGFRAQYARILCITYREGTYCDDCGDDCDCIHCTEPNLEVLEAVRDRYQVPVMKWDRWPAIPPYWQNNPLPGISKGGDYD